jgi:catalase
MSDERPVTTTDAGIPAASDEFSLTAGPSGPTVLHDHYVVQKMQHFNRERVPERVVHAKGSGAHGFFEVTEDVTGWTKASFLAAVGQRTPVFARFSTVAGELGSRDNWRDPRGFAVKLYTEEGNFDLVCNNTPVFFVRDASKFHDFIHSQKRQPDTGLRDNNMQWDFWTLSPESAHQVTILMSDRGTPRTWRHMNGYSSHTYSWVNADGERFWVKYHFKTVQGIQNLTDAEAKALAGEDPDAHRRDLWDAIAHGDAPEWRLEMQIMPFADAPLRRGRAVRVRSLQPGIWHRAEPGQDADGPDLLLPRHPPAPHRPQLPAAAHQRPQGARALLQQGRPHGLPARRVAADLRAELLRRPAGRPGPGG